MIKLTSRQEQVLNLIKDHISETGYPPTRADIAKQLGFKSANAAEEHLRALARKGFIEIVPGASRGIRIPASYTHLRAHETKANIVRRLQLETKIAIIFKPTQTS